MFARRYPGHSGADFRKKIEGLVAAGIQPLVFGASTDTLGVDQRSASYRGALNHGHVVEYAEVDPPVLVLGNLLVPNPVLLRFAGIRLRGPPAATLKYYFDVPERVYQELLNPPGGGHGGYFAANIKGVYRYARP